MRKPLAFLFVSTLLVIAAVFWTVGTGPVMMGGKEIVGLAHPEALLFLFAALALFAIALLVTFAAVARALIRRTSPAGAPAPPSDHAAAMD